MDLFKIFLVLFFCLPSQLNRAYEYCTPEKSYLCKDRKHTVCHPEVVDLGGTVDGFVPMTSKVRKMILHLHNAARNDTACGTIKSGNGILYPTATRIRKIMWDDELAFISHVHAERCRMDHDQCRATDRFRSAGQNLALTTSVEKPHKDLTQTMIKIAHAGWFEEYKLINDGVAAVQKLPDEDMTKIGHFTALVNDRTSRVGCAMVYCNTTGYSGSEKVTYTYYTTCNYDYMNMIGYPIYQSGKVGSNCSSFETSLSSDYPCLCDNNGKNYLKFYDAHMI